MIYAYGFKNFFGFNEGVDVSFRLDNKCPESVSMGRDFTPVLGVKGANGSGKTNLLKGLAWIAEFVSNSFKKDPQDGLEFYSFYFNDKPSEFYVEFKCDENSYRYELVADTKKVHSEIVYKTNSRSTKLIEREFETVKYAIKSLSMLKKVKIRGNASIISIAHQHELADVEEIYNFFDHTLSNVLMFGFNETPPDYHMISEMYHKHPDYFEFAKRFLKEFDLGIADVEILKRVTEDDKAKEVYFPKFVHEYQDGVGDLPFHIESSGTKSLYLQLGKYKWALAAGGILIHDEFDINLHPMMLPKLLELFLDKKTNPNNAQIIFTTHDSEILNFLTKYRTYFVNKEQNESYAYRLDEVPGDLIRNDRSLSNLYNQKKIGGVPRL